MTTGEVLIVIAAGTSSVVSIIGAIAQGWGRAAGREKAAANHQELMVKAADASEKLDEIHVLTNSNLSELKVQLAEAKARIDSLEKTLTSQFSKQTGSL